MPEPWTYDESDPDIEQMLKAIVGFHIDISRLEGKWKLNQNHSEERRLKVIRALETRTDDDSRAIARLIAATLQG
jgi:transcriptional regulator